jgi:SAM-dependent methyltransferase
MSETPDAGQRPWRGRVGGLWDEIGRLQFEYLVAQGLRPEDRFLDVGCGCLRGGVHFAAYLRDGHYHGVDRNAELVEAGLTQELPAAGLADRTVHLICRDDFSFSAFEARFDVALAQSVFTHLPWNAIRRCLVEMQTVLTPAGRFYATFFEDPGGAHPTTPMTHAPGDITTFPDQDPYHYEFSVFEDLACRASLRAVYVGEWNHPRAQRMMVFRHAKPAS